MADSATTAAASAPVNPLLKLFALLGPNQAPLTTEYDGLEFKWLMFSFRPALFITELYILTFVVALVGLFFVGKTLNEKIGKKWMAQHHEYLSSQFQSVIPHFSVAPLNDGPSTLLYYATGRRNVMAMHITFHLLPRHNLLELVFSYLRGLIDPPFGAEKGVFCDEVLIDLTLGEGANGFQGEGVGVWGVAEKGAIIGDLRKDRWDASFPKAIDYPSHLPATHILMQETADSTEVMFAQNSKTGKSAIGLAEMLKSTKEEGGVDLLKWLLVTDQPPYQPSKGPLPIALKSRHILARIKVDTSSKGKESTEAWLKVLVGNLPDFLAGVGGSGAGGKVVLKPETSRKLKKIRADMDAVLTSEYSKEMKESVAEEEEEKKRKERKEEAKRREAMSVEERKKLEEKERKRAQRKAQVKSIKRG